MSKVHSDPTVDEAFQAYCRTSANAERAIGLPNEESLWNMADDRWQAYLDALDEFNARAAAAGQGVL